MKVRIGGIVRFADFTLKRAAAGLSVEERQDLKESMARFLGSVERMLETHGGTVDDLPAPSRNAYRALKNLDVDTLSATRPDRGRPPVNVAVPSVVRMERRFADLLHRYAGSGPVADLLADIRSATVAIEAQCHRWGAAVSALDPRSRRLFGWLRFLSDEEHLRTHLRALERAGTFVTSSGDRARVDFLNQAALWSLRGEGPDVRVSISEGFISADGATWQALAASVAGDKSPVTGMALQRWASGPSCRSVVQSMQDDLYDTREAGRGVVHDLDERFDVVNREYFGGVMPKPLLTWSRTQTGFRFGTYHIARDKVMVSRTLDSPDVPVFVVDFVTYHELLHKRLGVEDRGTSTGIHTPEFRREEAKFARFAEAYRFLKELARRQAR